MKNNLFLKFSLILCVLLFFTAFAFEKNNTIQVSGIGVISFEPDVAYVSVGINGIFQDVEKGQKQVNDSINSFISKIKTVVSDKDISTERLVINNNYEYISGKRQFTGYNIEQQIKVKISNVTNIGKVIDIAVKSGLNNVGQIEFSSSKLEEYKQQALQLSLLDAKKKAELIAKTMEVKKIKLRLVSEANSLVQPYRNEGLQVKALSVADQTQYQVGEMKIMANVNVVYEF